MTVSIQERELMHHGIVRPLSQLLATKKEYNWATKPSASEFGKGQVWFDDIQAFGYSDGISWSVVNSSNADPTLSAGAVNVKLFGAKGDGTGVGGFSSTGTDDAPAIQALIDLLAPTGFVNLYFPKGVYILETPLVLPVLPTVVRFTGENTYMRLSTRIPDCCLYMKGTSCFVPSVAHTASALPEISIQMDRMGFYPHTFGTVKLFDTIKLTGSRITNCYFAGLLNLLYGAMWGVSSFDHNVVMHSDGAIFTEVPVEVVNPVEAVLVDSAISFNYLNGNRNNANPNYYLIHASFSTTTTITNNYIDFAFGGVYLKSTGRMMTISDNTFDILCKAIFTDFGNTLNTIQGNRFFHCGVNSRAAYFPTPSAEMNGTKWLCISLGSANYDTSIIGNIINADCDYFIEMGSYGYSDIKEYGNVGVAKTQKITMVNRTINKATYPRDNTNITLESLELKPYTTIPHQIFESYEGHSFYYFNILLVNRNSYYLDALGGKFIGGKTNLAPSLDYSSGWVPQSGLSITGGIVTGTASATIYNTLGVPLTAGTYLVYFLVATKTSGTITPKLKIDGVDAVGVGPYTADKGVGPSYAQFVVPGGSTATDLVLVSSSFIGTLSEYFIVKVA